MNVVGRKYVFITTICVAKFAFDDRGLGNIMRRNSSKCTRPLRLLTYISVGWSASHGSGSYLYVC